MYCPFCGYELPNDANFCQHCGKRMPDYNKTYSQPVENPINTSSVSQSDTSQKNTIDVRAILAKMENEKTEYSSPSSDTEHQKQMETVASPQTDVPDVIGENAEIEKKHNYNVGLAVTLLCGAICLFFLGIFFVGLCLPAVTEEPVTSGDSRVLITISSNPTGAGVYIGGDYMGSTPMTLRLMPDTNYMVVLKKNGYEQWAESINPGDGSNPISFNIALTPASNINPTLTPQTTISDTFIKQYDWSYGGHSWTTEIPISRSTYLKYKNMNRNADFKMYVTNGENSALVKNIANAILKAGQEAGFTKDQCLLIAVSFVQSIPYKTDSASTGMNEYYKYPIETLVDGCGDCEDSAILTAAIIKEMGYGVVLLVFDNHVAVGVKGGENVYGTYWTYNGNNYFYLETTGTGWDVGEIPADYANEKAKIIPIN